jgi:excinuclease UvrABC nuclease subunit
MDNFSLNNLPFVTFDNRKSLPNAPAVYFVISRWKEVLYVGRTRHLRGRWMNHHLMS